MAKRYELSDGFVAQRVIAEWIDFYNTERPDSAVRWSDTGRGLWHQGAFGYDGQGYRLAHIPAGSTATTGHEKQVLGGMTTHWNTP